MRGRQDELVRQAVRRKRAGELEPRQTLLGVLAEFFWPALFVIACAGLIYVLPREGLYLVAVIFAFGYLARESRDTSSRNADSNQRGTNDDR